MASVQKVVLTEKEKYPLVQNDIITQTSFELGKLNQSDAVALVAELIDDLEFNYFKLGGVLHTIRANEWFGSHGDFKSYVMSELGFKYHKANHLINIYTHLISSGLTWVQVKHLGWTKMRVIAPLLVGASPDAQQEWLSKASKMTVSQLSAHVSSLKLGESFTASEEAAKQMATLTFKLHGEQKEIISAALDKAKEAGHTDYDAVGLTYLCSDYIGQPQKQVHVDKDMLKTAMSDLGYETFLTLFEEVFPNVDLVVKH